jgi:hypothetical protein
VFVAAKIFIESARVLGCRLVIRRRAKSSHTAEFLDGERERERERERDEKTLPASLVSKDDKKLLFKLYQNFKNQILFCFIRNKEIQSPVYVVR